MMFTVFTRRRSMCELFDFCDADFDEAAGEEKTVEK